MHLQSWKRERIRLESLLAAKLPVPKIPVAVICTNLDSSAVQSVSNNLDLDVLKKTNKILDYKVFCLDSNIEDPQMSNVVSIYFRLIISLTLSRLNCFFFS